MLRIKTHKWARLVIGSYTMLYKKPCHAIPMLKEKIEETADLFLISILFQEQCLMKTRNPFLFPPVEYTNLQAIITTWKIRRKTNVLQ